MNIEKNKESRVKLFCSGSYARWCILAVLTLMFIIVLYPNLVITRYQYKIGDVAEKDIKAPIDFFIEDLEATKEKRRETAEDVLTVYDYDTALAAKLKSQVKEAFREPRAVIQSQEQIAGKDKTEQKALLSEALDTGKTLHDNIMRMKPGFEKKTGITLSNGAYKILENERFSEEIEDYIAGILTEILKNGVVANKEILLRETGKGINLREIGTNRERITYNLKKFYGLDQAKTMVRVIGQPMLKNLNYNLRNMIVDFVQRLIQPNITLNRMETRKRKDAAIAEINPVLYKIKAGEMILREGERVTNTQLLKLETLRKETKKEKLISNSFGATFIFVITAIIIYVVWSRRANITLEHNRNLLFAACLLMIFFLIAVISSSLSGSMAQIRSFIINDSSVRYGIPLASGAMIMSLFLGLNTACAFALLLTVSTAFIFQNRFELFLYFLLSGVMAAYWVQNCRERKVLIKAGIKLGFLNMVLAIAIGVYNEEFLTFLVLWNLVFAFMGGVMSGIVTTGIAPLLELIFDYTSDIKLLELSNLDQPLLKRLMIEAPGTYHHSVIVGSMVEAAASEIGANPLYAKVCGYYHDIGKIKKPLYFIENQVDGINKHDKLAPSMSALILIAHIKDGVEMAKDNKLGRKIVDTISQHHGTSLIAYFYNKARKLKGEDSVVIDDFRYPGPKPQTKETGLIMLADSVEAASRSLDNPTPARIRGQVQKIINNIFSDGQLDECELTLNDLHKIAKSFNVLLNGIHHHRIEYPEKTVNNNGKGKNGGNAGQQTRPIQDIPGESANKGAGHLRRLGL